jgi:hypothetical protein
MKDTNSACVVLEIVICFCLRIQNSDYTVPVELHHWNCVKNWELLYWWWGGTTRAKSIEKLKTSGAGTSIRCEVLANWISEHQSLEITACVIIPLIHRQRKQLLGKEIIACMGKKMGGVPLTHLWESHCEENLELSAGLHGLPCRRPTQQRMDWRAAWGGVPCRRGVATGYARYAAAYPVLWPSKHYI